MDPTAALRDICEYVVHDVNYDDARDLAVDLQEWLSKGGANPEFTQANCEAMMDTIFQLIAEVV